MTSPFWTLRRAAPALIATMAALATLPLLSGSASALEGSSPRCFITGGGTVDRDNFGGHAASYRNRPAIEGEWTHRTADGRTLHGDVDDLLCERNGGEPAPPAVLFSVARFGGTGTFDGQAVLWSATAQDHGEPGDDDRYTILITDLDGAVIYTIGGILDSGNFQIHPTNPGHP